MSSADFICSHADSKTVEPHWVQVPIFQIKNSTFITGNTLLYVISNTLLQALQAILYYIFVNWQSCTMRHFYHKQLWDSVKCYFLTKNNKTEINKFSYQQNFALHICVYLVKCHTFNSSSPWIVAYIKLIFNSICKKYSTPIPLQHLIK